MKPKLTECHLCKQSKKKHWYSDMLVYNIYNNTLFISMKKWCLRFLILSLSIGFSNLNFRITHCDHRFFVFENGHAEVTAYGNKSANCCLESNNYIWRNQIIVFNFFFYNIHKPFSYKTNMHYFVFEVLYDFDLIRWWSIVMTSRNQDKRTTRSPRARAPKFIR